MQGQSPLYGAVYHGRLHVVQHLLLHPQAADALLDKVCPDLHVKVVCHMSSQTRKTWNQVVDHKLSDFSAWSS